MSNQLRDADTPTPKAQAGTWTLTAPDGRTWQADSPIRCVSIEQRERVPADIALARIFSNLDDPTESGAEANGTNQPGQWVPREPTEAMLKAGINEWCRHNHGEPYDAEIPAIYRAMLAAAPAEPLTRQPAR